MASWDNPCTPSSAKLFCMTTAYPCHHNAVRTGGSSFEGCPVALQGKDRAPFDELTPSCEAGQWRGEASSQHSSEHFIGNSWWCNEQPQLYQPSCMLHMTVTRYSPAVV